MRLLPARCWLKSGSLPPSVNPYGAGDREMALDSFSHMMTCGSELQSWSERTEKRLSAISMTGLLYLAGHGTTGTPAKPY